MPRLQPYHHRKARGLCPACAGPRDSAHTYCLPCLERLSPNRQRTFAQRAARKAAREAPLPGYCLLAQGGRWVLVWGTPPQEVL